MHAHSRKRHGARRDTSDPPHPPTFLSLGAPPSKALPTSRMAICRGVLWWSFGRQMWRSETSDSASRIKNTYDRYYHKSQASSVESNKLRHWYEPKLYPVDILPSRSKLLAEKYRDHLYYTDTVSSKQISLSDLQTNAWSRGSVRIQLLFCIILYFMITAWVLNTKNLLFSLEYNLLKSSLYFQNDCCKHISNKRMWAEAQASDWVQSA